MQKLRSLHLYLGCLFAPLLLFFATSGIWQALGFNSKLLRKLSSIHTLAHWKDGSSLASFPLRIFVVIMAVSFIFTIFLGIIMALKFGRSRKTAWYCLALGFAVPLALVMLRVAGLIPQ